MTRATVIPYVRRPGFTGAEVTIHVEPPIVCRFEVGRIVDLPEPRTVERRGHSAMAVTKERQVTAADVTAVVDRIVDALRWRGYSIEAEIRAAQGIGVEAQRSRLIADALAPALRLVDIATVDAGDIVPDESAPKGREFYARASHIEPIPTSILATAGPPTRAPVTGPLILGIDPGSHWIACVVAELTVGAAPLRFVAGRTFDVGTLFPLNKPKEIQRADGSTFIRTHRREITDDDVATIVRDVVNWIGQFKISAVTVERVAHFYSGTGADGSVAAQLARMQWIGGELTGAIRARMSCPIETVSSRVWRNATKKLVPSSQWWDGVIANFGDTWPATQNEHMIDAAGCCVWHVSKPAKPVPRVPRDPSAPKPKREQTAKQKSARIAKRADERAASGCTCKPRWPGHRLGKHGRACPVFVPTTYKKTREAV